MKNYVQPILLDNEELAEGIYASGSGSSSDCWLISHEVSQRNSNPYDPFVNFRIKGTHVAQHISRALEMEITFNVAVQSAVFDFDGFECRADGMKVYVKRVNHANAYNTSDNFNTNLRVVTSLPELINITGITWKCDSVVNVQGGY